MILLTIVALATFAIACGTEGTTITIVNNALDPIHPNGGTKIEQGESRVVTTLKHGSMTTVTLERMGSVRATLTITSEYDAKEPDPQRATITVTEGPYWYFQATSNNSRIQVTVE
jgi:hypothetical protein